MEKKLFPNNLLDDVASFGKTFDLNEALQCLISSGNVLTAQL